MLFRVVCYIGIMVKEMEGTLWGLGFPISSVEVTQHETLPYIHIYIYTCIGSHRGSRTERGNSHIT